MKLHESAHPETARQARIEAIRRQLAAGTYRVDASALASALIETMQQKQRRRAA